MTILFIIFLDSKSQEFRKNPEAMTSIFSMISVLSAEMNFMASGNLITGGWSYIDTSLLTCLVIDIACQLKLQLGLQLERLHVVSSYGAWVHRGKFLRGDLWRTIILREQSENYLGVY